MAKLGYTLRTKSGEQVSLYPPQQVNVTQGYGGNYSHVGTLNLDNAATVPRLRQISAPFDCVVVRNFGVGYGIVIYHSLEKVMTPSGLHHVTLVLMHDNNGDRWKVGSTYKQGEHIYTEGDADPSELTTGIHVHMEVALGLEVDRITTGGRYHIVNQVKLEDAFFINGAEYINEIPLAWTGSERPYFKYYEDDGSVEPPDPPDPSPMRRGDIMPLYMLGILRGGYDGN